MKGTEAKGKTGRRYTEAEQKKVVDFVNKHPGRGGISAAQKKFGVSYVALRRWMNRSNGKAPDSRLIGSKEYARFVKMFKAFANKL